MVTARRAARLRLILLVALLAAAVSLALPGRTLAHAQFVRSSPEAGASLTSPPARIDVWFTERVAPGASTIALYDASRRRVDIGPTVIDPADARHMSATLPALPPGLYTVVWTNLSADDGHPDKGGFGFTVVAPTPTPGAGVAATPPAATASPTPLPPQGTSGSGPGAGPSAADRLTELVDLAATWVTFLALVLIGGGAVFALLCLRPALDHGDAVSQSLASWAERRYFRVALVAAVAGGLASLVSYLAKLALAAGAALGGAALGGALGSRSGHVWLAQEVAFALSAVVALAALRGPAAKAGRGRQLQTAAVLLAGVALVLQAFTSHLATGHAARQGPLGPVALAVHLLGAGLWVGGLGYGALVLWPLWRQADQAARAAIARSAIARFSLVALLSVVAIVVSGAYVAVLMIPRPSDLITSAYGIALDLKIALLLVLVGFGAANRKLLGQIAASAPRRVAVVATTGRRVLSAMRDEFLIAGLVLLAAAIMLEVGPPTLTLPSSAVTLTASATVDAPQAAATPTPAPAPTPTPFATRLSARGLSIQLTVEPPVAGARNTVRVVVTGPGGAPVTNAQVKLWLTNQSLDMGTQVVTAEPAGPGEYRVAAALFGAPGTWQVQLAVRRDSVPEAQATATVPVQAPAAASAAAAPAPTAPAAARTIHAELRLSPNPPRIGPATATLRLTDDAGRPVEGAQVSVLWVMAAHNHSARTTLGPVAGQPGTYQSRVSFIMGGAWTADASARLSDGQVARLSFAFNVAATPAPSGLGARSTALALGAALAFLGLAVGAVAFFVPRLSLAWRYGTIGLAIFLLAGGSLLLVRGVVEARSSAAAPATNPIPPSGGSVALGQAYYDRYCASCHGVSGHGDGPAAAGLNPPPADLTVHVNAHPDGVLFDWITNGIPGSAMPAFKDRISETNRWHLINYLHALASAAGVSAPVASTSVPDAPSALVWGEDNTLVRYEPATNRRETVATLPEGSQVGAPALSPDGRQYAVQYVPPTPTGAVEGSDLYLVDRASGAARPLVTHQQAGGSLGPPAWSPDGAYVYSTLSASSDRSDDWVVRVRVTGGPVERLRQGASQPVLTPDGAALVFVARADDGQSAQLWRARPDGSDAQPIAGTRFSDVLNPMVAPDGATVAFTAPGNPLAERPSGGLGWLDRLRRLGPAHASAHGGNWEVWTVPLAGGSATRRTSVSETQPVLTWSPDGQWLAVSGDAGLYLVRVKDGQTYLLYDVVTGFGLGWVAAGPGAGPATPAPSATPS